MKIFFALTMLALAVAHKDEHKKVQPIEGGEFREDRRELQTCECDVYPEIENYGFVYDDELSSTSTVEISVGRSSDDAEERVSDGVVSASGNNLELINDPSIPGDQIVGIRFNDIPVPQGSTIVSAYIEFTVDETDSGTTNLVIQGQAADDAGTFLDNVLSDISNRATTEAEVNWNPPAWTGIGDKEQTADLSPILQEIVNRAGWIKGNAAAFIITGSGKRTAKSFDGALCDSCFSCVPKLVIEYRVLGGTPDPSIFKRSSNPDTTARLITASGYPNKNWKLRGYPQGAQGDEAILPGNVYPLLLDGTFYPSKLNIKIKVAASPQWLSVNSRALFQYRLYDCSGSCTPTGWKRVINFDDDGTNVPPEEGSSEDLDENLGFFERTLDLTPRDSCYNFDYKQIEFQIVNTKVANDGENNKDFFVRQFYMDVEDCYDP